MCGGDMVWERVPVRQTVRRPRRSSLCRSAPPSATVQRLLRFPNPKRLWRPELFFQLPILLLLHPLSTFQTRLQSNKIRGGQRPLPTRPDACPARPTMLISLLSIYLGHPHA